MDSLGKPQYRAIFFSNSAKEDMDLRTEGPDDFYASASIKAELNSTEHVVTGQTL